MNKHGLHYFFMDKNYFDGKTTLSLILVIAGGIVFMFPLLLLIQFFRFVFYFFRGIYRIIKKGL